MTMTLHDPKSGSAPVLEPFQVFRRTGLYLGTALLALGAATVLGLLAATRGPVWLWAPAGVLALLGLIALPGVLDAQTPIFVADEHGVRLHERDNWVGLLWSEMGVLIVEPRSGRHDARIRIITKDGRGVHETPVGFTTRVSVAEAEVQLARRRAAASY